MPAPIPVVKPRLSDRLRRLREESGLTQAELGRLAGTTGVTISRAENDVRRLGATILRSVADVFSDQTGRPVGEILEELTRHD